MNNSDIWSDDETEEAPVPMQSLPDLPDFDFPDDELSVYAPPVVAPLTAVPVPSPSHPKRGCWFKGLVLLLVVSLLASSIASLLWLVDRAQDDTAVAPPTVNLPINPGRIAYINQNGQVVTVDPDGENGRLLTDSRSLYQFPAWSPDGQTVAAIGEGAIFLLPDAASGEPVSLYADDERSPFYLYWSPDGRLLSFLTNDAEDGIGLRVVALDNPQTDRLLATGSPFYWNWSGDSQQILIHTGLTGAEARLALLNTAEAAAAEEVAAPGFFQAPGISADGRFWAYAEDLGDATSWLVVTEQASSGRWQERHSGMVAMGWSPVGAKLAFTNGAQERSVTFWGPLRLFDAETGETRLLSGNTTLGFFWSPDGRYLATINTGDTNEDFGTNAADAGNGRRPALAKPNAQAPAHQFNLAVINVETGEETQLLSFTPSVLFISQFLPFFDQYALSHRIWSPNSDAVVLSVLEDGRSHVKVIPIDGGPVTDLGRGDMPFWSPGLSNP
jgi:TolB protein